MDERGAIGSHTTPTVDKSWDGPAAVAGAPNDRKVLRYMHAWVDSDGDPDAKGSYKFPHHAPQVGSAANLAGVRNALARLSGANIPEADRASVERHLRHHLAAADDRSARASAHSGIERRAFPVQLEVRAKSAGTSTIEGYASVVEAGYEMWDFAGPYTEVVRQGAFARTLNANPQVQLLLNHGGLAMAYTKAGTLRLSEDDTGLRMAADLNTSRHDVADMLAAIDDGAVDEMSFAFRVTRQQWSPDYDQRDILEVDLHRGDVSVVNFGANPDTSVAAVRSADFDRLDEAAARALYERLARRLAPPKPQRNLALLRALAQSQG